MYQHEVKYYETDKMGITHHSNYIRWMEEARLDFFNQLGLRYDELGKQGIISPVVSVQCQYKLPTTFPELISIDVTVESISPARYTVSYVMRNASGKVVCEAKSEHCFINTEGKIVRINKEYPEFHEKLIAMCK